MLVGGEDRLCTALYLLTLGFTYLVLLPPHSHTAAAPRSPPCVHVISHHRCTIMEILPHSAVSCNTSTLYRLAVLELEQVASSTPSAMADAQVKRKVCCKYLCLAPLVSSCRSSDRFVPTCKGQLSLASVLSHKVETFAISSEACPTAVDYGILSPRCSETTRESI